MSRVAAPVRRRQLIEAAFRVMEREGIAHATTRAIAAEAGAHLASLHYCFRSKEELLRELTPTVIDEQLALAIAATRPGQNVRDSLRASLRAVWSYAEAAPGKQQVLYELTHYALRNPALADLARWQYERYFDVAAQYLDELSRTAQIDWAMPVPVMSRMLVSLLDGLTLNWLVDHNSEHALAVLDTFADAISALARPQLASALSGADTAV